MVVNAPPNAPPQHQPVEDELEALIEEARRRARRRRLRYAAAALAAAGFASASFAFSGGGGPTHGTPSPPPRSPLHWASPTSAASRSAGNLSVIGDPPESTQSGGTGRDGWYSVSSIDAQGRLRHLVRCPAGAAWCGEVESLAWSPGGRWLALSVSSFGNANPYNGIHVIDVRNRTDTQIRDCQFGECDWFDLHWSGDGARLAYVTGGRIYLIPRSGSGGPVLLRTRLDGRMSSPSWSPDGERIVFAASPSPHARAAVYSIRVDGTDRRLLAEGGSAPAWSADGTRIAFTSRCKGIKLVTPEGTDVTPGGSRRCRAIGVSGVATWSPDGHRLAIAAVTGSIIDGRPGIYLVDADGTGLRLLTSTTAARAVTGGAGLSWQAPAAARRAEW
jgi:hypothetical protein